MMSVIGDRSGVTVGDTIDAGWSHLGQCNAARHHVFPRAVLASLKSVETLTAVMRLWGSTRDMNHFLKHRLESHFQHATLAIVTWIEKTYHRARRQRRLGRLTPIEFETINRTAHAA